MRRIIVGLLVVFMAAGCSASTGHGALGLPGLGSAKSYADNAALKSALADAGYKCNWKAGTPDTSSPPVAVTEDSCTIEGHEVQISVYKSSSDRIASLVLGMTLGCGFLKDAGIKQIVYVTGGAWIVATDFTVAGGPALTRKLGDALGVPATTHNC
jgi:hypothetical protein